MFDYELLPDNSGIVLFSSHRNMWLLDYVLSEVNEASPGVVNKEGFLREFASMATSACDGNGEVIEPDEDEPQTGTSFGFRVAWPLIISQCAALRFNLGLIDSSKMQQSVTYALEDVLEEAVKEAFGPYADSVIKAWKEIAPDDPLFDNTVRECLVAYRACSPEERAANLAFLLLHMSPLWVDIQKQAMREEEDGLQSAEGSPTRH